jgi:hypothetical protein
MSALEIQSEYHSRAAEFADREGCAPSTGRCSSCGAGCSRPSTPRTSA